LSKSVSLICFSALQHLLVLGATKVVDIFNSKKLLQKKIRNHLKIYTCVTKLPNPLYKSILFCFFADWNLNNKTPKNLKMFMKIINFNQSNSLFNQFLSEIRDVHVQGDRIRFRRNIERVGEIMAYEISRTLPYHPVSVQTPLATAVENVPSEQPVVATILREGLPLHQGFINYFDHAENAFVYLHIIH
jgi:hypothetical protein